jgi:class 3 adenylate cyclase
VATAVLTLLFTDLVGSTALASRVAVDEADTLRRAHLGLLREAVSATGGSEVKNLGDGLMVAFQSPSRALACAVAMQQAIERHNGRGGPALTIRIGISGGEVTAEDGDFFGDPVVEAARLCAAAEGGQVLVAATVKAMVGRHTPAELVDVGEFELKGLPAPVAAAELGWRTATRGDATGDVPLPPRLAAPTGGGFFPFAGRRAELDALADALKRAGAGQLQVVLVGGEPGIGKTTLVAEAARIAYAGGAVVTFGACRDGLAAPYQPWIGALTHVVAQTRDTLPGLSPVHASYLAALLPSVADRFAAATPVSASGDAERYLLLESIAALLERLSAEATLVVVLDDLQWADAGSIDVLRHLLGSPSSMRLMVLVTYRPSDLGRTNPLTAVLPELRREAGVARVDLVGLDDLETVELIESAAGFELPPDGVQLAHVVRQETGGNPFFTVELLRHLAESGAIQLEPDGTYSLVGGIEALELPNSVREVVAHRVRRLGDDAERVLSLAAVIGLDFDLDVLAAVSDRDEDVLLEVLDAAAGAGIVTEASDAAGRYRFVHALVAHTLAHDLGPTRRQRAHHRAAEALEALGAEQAGRVAELAHHWLAATRPADTDRAVHYAIRAGEAALAALAPDDAVVWFERALAVFDRSPTPEPAARARLLVGLGRAQMEAGRPAHRETLREAGHIARAIGDRELLIEVALCRLPGFEVISAVDADRLAVVEAALDAVGPGASTERVRLLLALAEEQDRRDWRRWQRIVDDAIELTGSIADTSTQAALLAEAIPPIMRPDNLERRRELAERVLRLADPTQRVVRCLGLNAFAFCCIEAAERDRVDAASDEACGIADTLGSPYLRWVTSLISTFRLLLDGNIAAAEASAMANYDLAVATGNAAAVPVLAGQLSSIRQLQGRLGEVVEFMQQGRREQLTTPGWDASLASIFGELGRHDEQGALVDAALASGFSNVLFDTTYLIHMQCWAESAVEAERPDAAAYLADLLAPYANRFSYAGAHTHGAVARPLGRVHAYLGRDADGEMHLRRSLALHEQMRAPYWIARSQIDLAQLLHRTGRRSDASSLLDEARGIASTYAFDGLRHRIAAA